MSLLQSAQSPVAHSTKSSAVVADQRHASKFNTAADKPDSKPFQQHLDEAVDNKTPDNQKSQNDQQSIKAEQLASQESESVVKSAESIVDPAVMSEEAALIDLEAGNILPPEVISEEEVASLTQTPVNLSAAAVVSNKLSSQVKTDNGQKISNTVVAANSETINSELEADAESLTEFKFEGGDKTNNKQTAEIFLKADNKEPVVNQRVLSSPTGLSSAVVNAEPLQKDALPLNSQTLSLHTPVQQKQWGQEFAQRIAMMVSNGQQQVAELRLNPARMGSIDVRIQIDDDKANISFLTTQYAVKEAIEVSLPRLKEQLEQQGLSLGHVDVSDKSEQQTEQGNDFKSQSSGNTGLASADEGAVLEEINYQINSGLSVFV